MNYVPYKIYSKGFLRNKYEVHADDGLLYIMKLKPFLTKCTMTHVSTGITILSLKRKASFFRFKYVVYDQNTPIAVIKSKKKGLKTEFFMEKHEPNYYLRVDRIREYTILNGAREIAKVSRKQFKRGLKYTLAIEEDEDQALVLLFLMTQEITIRSQRAAAS